MKKIVYTAAFVLIGMICGMFLTERIIDKQIKKATLILDTGITDRVQITYKGQILYVTR